MAHPDCRPSCGGNLGVVSSSFPVSVELASRGEQLRVGGFAAVRRGVRVSAGIDTHDADVRIAAVAATLPEHAVLGGWSAGRVHELASGRDDVVFDGGPRWEERSASGDDRARVLVCADRHSRLVLRDDVRVFRSPAGPEARATVLGLPVTTPTRTALDLARLLPFTSAVIGVDRLLHLGATTQEELVAAVTAPGRWRGRPAARRVVLASDPGAESPQETVLRLLWVGAGLPRPVTNARILDVAGRFVARVDLLDPDAGVVGEYDGAYHSSSERRSKDAAVQEALEHLGLVMVRATSPDVEGRGRLAWVGRLRSAYARASRRPAEARRWIVAP